MESIPSFYPSILFFPTSFKNLSQFFMGYQATHSSFVCTIYGVVCKIWGSKIPPNHGGLHMSIILLNKTVKIYPPPFYKVMKSLERKNLAPLMPFLFIFYIPPFSLPSFSLLLYPIVQSPFSLLLLYNSKHSLCQ